MDRSAPRSVSIRSKKIQHKHLAIQSGKRLSKLSFLLRLGQACPSIPPLSVSQPSSLFCRSSRYPSPRLTLSISLSHCTTHEEIRESNVERERGTAMLSSQPTGRRTIGRREREDRHARAGGTYSIGVNSCQEASSGAGPFGREGFAIASESTDRAVLTEGERGRGHELENEEEGVVREERNGRKWRRRRRRGVLP
jgi:hypothetical protein